MQAPSDHLLRTLAAVPVACRVLDLECRDGRHTDPIARLGFDWWACDSDRLRVEALRRTLAGTPGVDEVDDRVTVARPTALGFPDGHFDWIVACGTFDAAAEPTQMREILDEVMRVLRPGGWLYTAVASEVEARFHPAPLLKIFQEAGFAVAEQLTYDGEVVRGIFRRTGPDVVG